MEREAEEEVSILRRRLRGGGEAVSLVVVGTLKEDTREKERKNRESEREEKGRRNAERFMRDVDEEEGDDMRVVRRIGGTAGFRR